MSDSIRCWWCRKPLQKVMVGPKRGELSFGTSKQDGRDVRVHKICKTDADAYRRTPWK